MGSPLTLDPGGGCGGGELQSAPEPSEDWILSSIGKESIDMSDWSEMNMMPFHGYQSWNDIEKPMREPSLQDSALSHMTPGETVEMDSTSGEAFYSERQSHSLSWLFCPQNDITQVSALGSISPCEDVPSPELRACKYNLPCEFAPLRLQVNFSPGDYQEWMTHTMSHFECFPLASTPSSPYFDVAFTSFYPLCDENIESKNSTSHSSTRRPSPGSISPCLETQSGGDFRQRGSYCSKCGDFFKDLKAHLLANKFKRRQKCPIQTCGYKAKGFAGKYNVDRHLFNEHRRTTCSRCVSRADVPREMVSKWDSSRGFPSKSSEGGGIAAEVSFSDAFDYSNQSSIFDWNIFIFTHLCRPWVVIIVVVLVHSIMNAVNSFGHVLHAIINSLHAHHLNDFILHFKESYCSSHESGQMEEEEYRHGRCQKFILTKQSFMAEWNDQMNCNMAPNPEVWKFRQLFNTSVSCCFSSMASILLLLWKGSSPWRAKSHITALADERHSVGALLTL